jgi:serine/threonine protein phosphatase PrpC
MIKYNYAPKTAIGGRKENQDTEGSCVTKFGFLSIVCDGMGGAAGGKTASTMAVNIIMQEVLNSQSNMPAQALMMAIKKANQEIYHRGRQQTELRGMGTTATALIINEEKVTIAHAGDSRVYQLRDGEKVFRTNDHSKVFELVKRGILSEEQARLSEESNIIQRALGIAPEIEVEINDNIPFLKGDIFMLCTDGVCGALPEEDLLQLLKKEKDIKQLSDRVVRQIDLLGNQHGGGHDNLTLALIKPLSNSKLEVIIDMKTKTTIYSLAAMVALLALFVGYLLFFDKSKSQIAELEVEVRTLKDSLQKISNKVIQKQPDTSGLATIPKSKTKTENGIQGKTTDDGLLENSQGIPKAVPKSGGKKAVNLKTSKENDSQNSEANKEVPYKIKEIPENDQRAMGIGRRILEDNKIEPTNENLKKLEELNKGKIDWNSLKVGDTIPIVILPTSK